MRGPTEMLQTWDDIKGLDLQRLHQERTDRRVKTLRLRHTADTNDVPFIDLARALIQSGVRVEVRVEAEALSEALQGATEALQHAEATLAKGGCGDLFVGIDEGGMLGDSLRRSEGMDERDVFLSLMRSLPGESQALNREVTTEFGEFAWCVSFILFHICKGSSSRLQSCLHDTKRETAEKNCAEELFIFKSLL
eukprot:Skav214625  [mRNA]  locus=scaffold961:115530:130134:- [translate_table: standard]